MGKHSKPGGNPWPLAPRRSGCATALMAMVVAVVAALALALARVLR